MEGQVTTESGWLVEMRTLLLAAALLLCVSSLVRSQTGIPIRIALADSTRALIQVDSLNWQEAWIETLGEEPQTRKLLADDLSITSGRDTATILSVDSTGALYRSNLEISFVLDNSVSMFHSYDSLTKYLDLLIDSLPTGVRGQAIVFDSYRRTRTHRLSETGSVYLAQTGFQDSLVALSRFWHYYDTVRVARTPFFDAIRLAVENINDPEKPQVVIAVTDGDDNESLTSVDLLGRIIRGSRVKLFLVTINDISLRLKWLAKKSRGAWYYAADDEDLRNLLHDLGLTMSRSYHVRYLFPSPSPSSPTRHE